jgi:hypothetical protein
VVPIAQRESWVFEYPSSAKKITNALHAIETRAVEKVALCQIVKRFNCIKRAVRVDKAIWDRVPFELSPMGGGGVHHGHKPAGRGSTKERISVDPAYA